MRIIRPILAIILALTAVGAVAATSPKTSTQTVPPFPGSLQNARYVFVTSYDGNQFDLNLVPEDRQAISAVQDAIQKWGKWTVVYKPEQADVVLMVTGRPSEDILAVYDARGWRRDGMYLWRMTGRNGLQSGETPLVTNLENAFDQAGAKK